MVEFNRVLLVEDNPADARLVVEYLHERFGTTCQVRHEPTLARGLTALAERPFDVVLLDLGLPDSQGLGTVFQLSRAAPRTPVVILTGHADEDQAVQALRHGAEDYLAKRDADSITLVRAMRHAVQRRQSTDVLRDSEARLRAIVETAEEGILMLDRSGAIVFSNPRLTQMLRPRSAGPDGAAAGTVEHIAQFVAPSQHAEVAMLLNTPVGQRSSCELQLLCGDGAPCWVVAAAGGYVPHSGAPPGVVLLLSDITGRKLAEEELRDLKDDLEARVADRTARLQAANQDLEAVNRAMAHDLRNPLNGIIGLTRLVRSDTRNPLPDTAERRLKMVEQSALDMNELIAGLLSLATLGRQPVNGERLDLSAMVTTIADRMSQANPERVVRWRIEPGVHGTGDRVLVADVLQNLIGNAWKYTGQVDHAVIEFGQLDRPGEPTAYYVRDNGVGFDMAAAHNLFEPFQRLSTSAGFAGTGIGLASVRRIVERHGGSVWADSAAGRSTTFAFTLAAPAAAAPSAEAPVQGDEPYILLVEDNPGDARLAQALLAESGPAGAPAPLRWVQTAAAAVAMLNGSPRCSVVLLDLGLPDAHGLDALHAIVQTSSELAVVVLTGDDSELTGLDAVQHGAQDFLVKGRFDAASLKRSIAFALQRKRTEAALARKSLHDDLTGLPRRELFLDRLQRAMAQSARSAAPGAVLFIDLDGFKLINDRHGHAAGDLVLRAMAGRLAGLVRSSDTVARLGGDEFVVLLPVVADSHDAEAVGVKLLGAIEETVAGADGPLSVSASIGVAHFQGTAETAEQLVTRADRAMYAAKAAGKGRVCRL